MIKTDRKLKTNRPKIKVPLEPIDIIVDLVTVTIFIIILVYTYISYGNLPETIPTHFNVKGIADGFGDKITLWLLPTIGIVLFVGMFFLNKFPHIHNYKVNITEGNALKNYRLSTRIIRFTNLFIAFIFGLITHEIIHVAQGNENGILGIPFLIFTITIPLIGIAFIFYYQNKINK